MEKAPPGMGARPASPGEDPVLPGITIVSWRDAGSADEWKFTVNRGEEDAASRSLIDALDATTEFHLFDYGRKDPDAYGSYHMEDGRIAFRSCSHGRFGDLEFLDREAAIAMARKQVLHNYGAPKSEFGTFWKKKSGYPPSIEDGEPRFTPFQKVLGWLMWKFSP